MWDGYWWLVNRRRWSAIPADLREIVAKHINRGALSERNDVASLNASLQSVLERKGLTFNKVDPASFTAQLKTAGFYSEWKGKYGEEAWDLLEQVTGKLA